MCTTSEGAAMTRKIALNFEDGVTRFIDANMGETVAGTVIDIAAHRFF